MDEKKIWFTSDLHFGHQKDFLWAPRGFSSSDEHDAAVIKTWNELIDMNDDVYILGDLMLNDNDAGMKKMWQLNGNLHIILGNHDTDTRVELYKTLPRVEEVVYARMLKYKKCHFYMSHYPTITANFDDDKPYHKNLIDLFGHTHQKEKFYNGNPYMYCVGLDAHNNRPVEINEIIEDIKQRRCELNNEHMRNKEVSKMVEEMLDF